MTFICVRAGNILALMYAYQLTLHSCVGLELYNFSVAIVYQQRVQEGRGNESHELHGRTGARISRCAPPQRRPSRASIEMGGDEYLRHPGVVPSHRGSALGDPVGHPPEEGSGRHSVRRRGVHEKGRAREMRDTNGSGSTYLLMGLIACGALYPTQQPALENHNCELRLIHSLMGLVPNARDTITYFGSSGVGWLFISRSAVSKNKLASKMQPRPLNCSQAPRTGPRVAATSLCISAHPRTRLFMLVRVLLRGDMANVPIFRKMRHASERS